MSAVLTSTITGDKPGIGAKTSGKAPEEPKARGGKFFLCCKSIMLCCCSEVCHATCIIIQFLCK